jgi:hypothetical protein
MGGPFIAPQGNLVVGVLETQTPVKAERLDMSRLGAEHVQDNSLEPG